MLNDLIFQKASGIPLNKQQMYDAVTYLMKNGADSNSVKFFMALHSFGMSKKEVLYLALAMRDSGKVVKYDGTVFEKHSTGGVGDSTSLVIIPLLASLGYKIVKNTGKSLTYTNGSADRFGSIPKFAVKFNDDEVTKLLDETNACVLSHNGLHCPADRYLFEIMEKCGLEGDINLLAASIASKKLASGATVVLVDVKYGPAAVIKSFGNAMKMSKILKFVFNACNVKSTIVITDTAQMIGSAVGNALEVVDALYVLQGKKCLLRDIASDYAVELITKTNNRIHSKDAYDMVANALDSGMAYNKFLDIVRLQGGKVSVIKNGRLFVPYKSKNIISNSEGYVGAINSLILGELIRRLCAETHDSNIGVVLHAKVGDYIKVGDPILSFYYKDDEDFERYERAILGCVRLTKSKIAPVDVIRKVVR